VKDKSHIPRRPRTRHLRLHRSNRLLQLQAARDRAGESSGIAISPSPEASLSHRHSFFQVLTRVLRFADEEGEREYRTPHYAASKGKYRWFMPLKHCTSSLLLKRRWIGVLQENKNKK